MWVSGLHESKKAEFGLCGAGGKHQIAKFSPKSSIITNVWEPLGLVLRFRLQMDSSLERFRFATTKVISAVSFRHNPSVEFEVEVQLLEKSF